MKRYAILFGTVAAVALLAGCATAYQAQGISGGFSETQLDKNAFRVTFRGNGMTSPERAADFTLLRSAELTLQNGYTHFIIVDSVASTRKSTVTTPTQSTTAGTATVTGNTAYGSAQTTTYGGDTYTVRKPSLTDTIICFNGKPDVPGMVYDAAFLRDSLTKKYGVDAKP